MADSASAAGGGRRAVEAAARAARYEKELRKRHAQLGYYRDAISDLMLTSQFQVAPPSAPLALPRAHPAPFWTPPAPSPPAPLRRVPPGPPLPGRLHPRAPWLLWLPRCPAAPLSSCPSCPSCPGSPVGTHAAAARVLGRRRTSYSARRSCKSSCSSRVRRAGAAGARRRACKATCS